MNTNGITSYRKTGVITADPERLLLMCYEAAIINLKTARQHIEAHNYEAKNKALSKTRSIIAELICALNFEKGGDIAKKLDALYNYIQRRLLRADIQNDLQILDEVLGLLTKLQSAWVEIARRPSPIVEADPAIADGARVAGAGYICA